MQERGRKLRLALLLPMLGLAAGLAGAQTTGVNTTSTTSSRTGVTTTRNFLGTRSGPTSLGTSTSPGGTIASSSSTSTASAGTPTPSLAASPGPVGASGTTSARTNGDLDCPTLAGIAEFAGCGAPQ